mmetsp:Transcript_113805/g.367697  ORF Transcript_113805/g.367697 Transcript_113805/m.367697 type:complete len:233 (-) Transcript_113805:869-1567(-)
MALRPVSGSLMSLSSSSIAPSSLSMERSMSPSSMTASDSSFLHHSFFLWSTLPSSLMFSSILVISSSVVVKGLPDCSRAAAFASRGKAATLPAKVRSARTAIWPSAVALAPPPWWRRRAERWKNSAALLVAFTLPKAAKALSLSRIATAWEMAASSLARSLLRALYSFVFSEHMGRSFSKNSSRTLLCSLASLSCSFFVPSVLSFSPRAACLSPLSLFMSSKASCLVTMNSK